MTKADFCGCSHRGRFFPGKNFLRGFSVCVRTPEFGKPEGRTGDPSTALRSGRDDKGGGQFVGVKFAMGLGRLVLCPSDSSNANGRNALPLSSRPERSVAEGSAVRPSGLPKFWSSHAEAKAPEAQGPKGNTRAGVALS